MGIGSQYRECHRMVPGGSLSARRAAGKSGGLYKKLFQINLNPMVLTEIDGRIIDVNENFLHYTGYRKEELLNRKCSDLKLWEPANSWERLQRKLFRFDSVSDFEAGFIFQTGERYTGLLTAEVIEDGDGRYILIILGRPREQRGESGKGSEGDAALRERVRAGLTEAVRAGKLEKYPWACPETDQFGMTVLDGRNRIVLANQNYSGFLGYRPEELKGKHFNEFTDQDDLLFGEAIESVIDGSQSTLSYEKKYEKKNGEIAWGKLHICQIDTEQDGGSYKLILREDITSTRERDLAPHLQQRIYRALIGAVTESILQRARHDQEETGAASSSIFGMMVSERLLPLAGQLIGAREGICYGCTRQGDRISFYGRKKMCEREAGRLRDKLRSAMEKPKGILKIMMRSKRPVYISYNGCPCGWEEFAPKQGSYFLIPLCYGKRVYSFYCLTNRDGDGFTREQQLIAESLGSYLSLAMENARLFSETARLYHRRNKAQEEDFKAQKLNAVGTLAGGMAHELNNQLSIIYACVDLSLHHVSRNSALHRNILKIQGAAYKSANITRQLLLFGNKQPQFKVILDINRLLTELRSLLERIAGESRILSYDLAPDLWLTYADAANIEQAVINLVLNARDAMPEGGRIMVATGNALLGQSRAKAWGVEPGRYICMTITDTGCGIKRDDIQHIFEPFFTTKEQGSGTGLGLSVAYGIVQAHHGRISVRSKPGRGSAFEIYLPVAQG